MMPTQKNTLMQAAQCNAENNACKRVFFQPPKKNFCPPYFLIKLFRHRTGSPHNLTMISSNVNRFQDSFVLTSGSDNFGQRRRASANS